MVNKNNKKRSKKKRQGFFSRNYKLSWKFLKESRNFIYFIIGVFLLFVLIGYFVPTPDFLKERILKMIENLLNQTEGLGQFELIKFILLNNLQASFSGLIFGVFLGIFPVLVAIANGYLLGFVAVRVALSEGISALFSLLPHGIFELPAVFISLGLGLKLGTFIFRKNIKESFKNYFLESLRVFVFIIIPLLIIAAIIEGTLIFILG